MAIVRTDDKYYKQIADIARANDPRHGDTKFLPSELKFALQEACDWQNEKGYEEGFEEGEEYGKALGITEGIEQGKQEAYTEIEGINSQLEQTLYGTDTDKSLEANVEQTNADFQAIKSAIVESGVEVADGTRTAEYGAKVTEVYDKGRQDEYDAFWDACQDYGNRNYYSHAFAGVCWGGYAEYLQSKGEVFKPKYPIVFKAGRYSSERFMYKFNRQDPDNGEMIDLTEFCKMVDFSAVTTADQIFTSAKATNITADFSNATNLSYTFAMLDGGRIVRINLKVTEKCTDLTTAFAYNATVLWLTFMEGSVIAANIDLHWAAWLYKESFINVIEHLSTTTSGKTASFSKDGVDRAFGSTENEEWIALVNSRQNWTFSLV